MGRISPQSRLPYDSMTCPEIKQRLQQLLMHDGQLVWTRVKTREVRQLLSCLHMPAFDSVSERAWAILNDVELRPTCAHCGNLTRFNRPSAGYFQYCGASCASNATSKRGSEHHFASSQIKEQIAETNLQKYGVRSPLQLEHIHALGVDASKTVNYDRGSNFKDPEFTTARQAKIQQGTYHAQLEATKAAIKASNLANYRSKTLPPKIEALQESGYDLVTDLNDFCRFSKTTWKHSCGEIFESIPNCRFNVFCPNCKKAGVSLPHQLLLESLRDLGISYVVNDRRELAPKELDIFFPEHRVAVEINGVFFHHEGAIERGYHAQKTQAARERGIRLLHFWDFEILTKREQVLDIIKSSLGLCTRIPARRCTAVEIDKHEAQQFCDAHHLNGSANCSYAVGIYFGNELLGVTLLGRARFGTHRQAVEIIRMCFKSGMQVIGGVSKMIKKIQQLDPRDIISYQDGRLGFGAAYERAGFKLEKHLGPNYIYVKGTRVLSRQQAMKHKLPKILGSAFDETRTEKQNMSAAGWLICYDAGHLLWKLERRK